MANLSQLIFFDEAGNYLSGDLEQPRHVTSLFPDLDWDSISHTESTAAFFRVDNSFFECPCSLEIFPTVLEGKRLFACIIRKRRITRIHGNLDDLRLIIDSMPFGAALIDRKKNVHFMNRAALKLAGFDSFEEYAAQGLTCQESFCPAPLGGCPIWDLGALFDHTERPFLLRDGTRILVEKTAVPVMIDGQEMMLEGLIDLRPQKEAERAAQTDALTGLFNRLGLCYAARTFEAAPRYCVFVVDVNNLKAINDGWGHSKGDEVIRLVSAVLHQIASNEGVVGRWGGDEFVMLEKGPGCFEDGRDRCEKISRAVETRSEELVQRVTVSVGHAVSRYEGERWEEVFDRADSEMYAAKRSLSVGERSGDPHTGSGRRCPACGVLLRTGEKVPKPCC